MQNKNGMWGSLAKILGQEIPYERNYNANSWNKECTISNASVVVGRVFKGGKKGDGYEVSLVLSGTRPTEQKPRPIELSNKKMVKKIKEFGGEEDREKFSILFKNWEGENITNALKEYLDGGDETENRSMVIDMKDLGFTNVRATTSVSVRLGAFKHDEAGKNRFVSAAKSEPVGVLKFSENLKKTPWKVEYAILEAVKNAVKNFEGADVLSHETLLKVDNVVLPTTEEEGTQKFVVGSGVSLGDLIPQELIEKTKAPVQELDAKPVAENTVKPGIKPQQDKIQPKTKKSDKEVLLETIRNLNDEKDQMALELERLRKELSEGGKAQSTTPKPAAMESRKQKVFYENEPELPFGGLAKQFDTNISLDENNRTLSDLFNYIKDDSKINSAQLRVGALDNGEYYVQMTCCDINGKIMPIFNRSVQADFNIERYSDIRQFDNIGSIKELVPYIYHSAKYDMHLRSAEEVDGWLKKHPDRTLAISWEKINSPNYSELIVQLGTNKRVAGGESVFIKNGTYFANGQLSTPMPSYKNWQGKPKTYLGWLDTAGNRIFDMITQAVESAEKKDADEGIKAIEWQKPKSEIADKKSAKIADANVGLPTAKSLNTQVVGDKEIVAQAAEVKPEVAKKVRGRPSHASIIERKLKLQGVDVDVIFGLQLFDRIPKRIREEMAEEIQPKTIKNIAKEVKPEVVELEAVTSQQTEALKPIIKKRGRPVGSKNKPKEGKIDKDVEVELVKKPTNIETMQVSTLTANAIGNKTVIDVEKEAEPESKITTDVVATVKKKRGRPVGSKNKPKDNATGDSVERVKKPRKSAASKNDIDILSVLPQTIMTTEAHAEADADSGSLATSQTFKSESRQFDADEMRQCMRNLKNQRCSVGKAVVDSLGAATNRAWFSSYCADTITLRILRDEAGTLKANVVFKDYNQKIIKDEDTLYIGDDLTALTPNADYHDMLKKLSRYVEKNRVLNLNFEGLHKNDDTVLSIKLLERLPNKTNELCRNDKFLSLSVREISDNTDFAVSTTNEEHILDEPILGALEVFSKKTKEKLGDNIRNESDDSKFAYKYNELLKG